MNSLLEALSVTVFGILIVFFVLLILMLILNAMRLFSTSTAEEGEKGDSKAEDMVISESASEDEDELIAVLTAAIAASDFAKELPTYGFKIKSYKRLY